MKRYAKGYTQGVFDMFHVGHLNLLNNAKKRCETLFVGVNSDRLVREYKHRAPVIPDAERCQIVQNIAAVDSVLLADTLDKMEMHRLLGFDVVFVGSDWEGNPRWQAAERALSAAGVDVVYLPYTRGVCSTDLRDIKDRRIEE
jgi:glycerol-3-phosphate cytidylyltransferase